MNTLMAGMNACVYMYRHTHFHTSETVPWAPTNLKQARLFIKRWMLLFVSAVIWQSILMHDNVGFFPVPGSAQMHPVCLLQKDDDKDKLLFIGGLLYFPVAREGKRGQTVLYTRCYMWDFQSKAKLRYWTSIFSVSLEIQQRYSLINLSK